MLGLQQLFQLRYEDRRKVWVMGSVFLLAGISEMVNYTSFMALFNSRLGTAYLPLMYLLEAFILPAEGWLLSYFSRRLTKPSFMKRLYVLFVMIGLLNGAVLLLFRFTGLEWAGFYIVLFLTSNFVIRQQTLLMWSTAFDLCPTQQAKRLMPVFVIMAIVGGIIAGILSNTLAPVLGPELLYILAAGLLLAGLPNFIRSLKQFLVPLSFSAQEEEQASGNSLYYVKRTLRSPFLLTVVGIMTLMPALYFLMEYQYFTSAQAAFPDEAELTAFYGMMVMLLFCGALLLQLFAARLMERMGVGNTILSIAAMFLISFVLVSAFIHSFFGLAAASIGYGLTYLLLYYFAEPGYQLYFKMMPLQHRDGYRYTAQSISASAGILLGSAASMLHSEAGLSLSVQAIVGTIAALGLLGLTWTGRHLYIKELVRQLQDSTVNVRNFLQDMMESMNHERVRRELIRQLNHKDESIQSIALELFRRQPVAAASQALFDYAERSQTRLRALALQAVHPDGWLHVAQERVQSWLQDEDEEVRAIVYKRLFAARSEQQDELVAQALTDGSPLVRAEALHVMQHTADLEDGLRHMLGEGGRAAVLACEVIGERKLTAMQMDVMMCLLQPIPVLKIAAVRALGKLGGQESVISLTELLVGADTELRAAIEAALIDCGSDALPELRRFVDSPNDEIWKTAISVMNASGTEHDLHEQVVPSCVNKLQELQANDHFVSTILHAGNEEWALLARKRNDELSRSMLDVIWQVMVRFGDERTVPNIRLAVESDDEEVRDHGLEILSEGLGNAKLSAALLAYYQAKHGAVVGKQAAHEAEAAAASELISTDPWMQAIAIRSGVTKGESELMGNWDYLHALDKIVFLKQVSLFEEISIEELGKIAGIATEAVYQDGEYLTEQGKTSDSLFIIMEGHVEISGTNDDGVEGTIGVISSKQTVGEASLFDESPSAVSAQVIFAEARVLKIERKEVEQLVRLYPDIGVGLLRAVGSRLRTLEEMVLKLG